MAKILVRQDNYSNWNSANPTLDFGEFGYDKTHKVVKIGNGLSNWDSLPVVNDSSRYPAVMWNEVASKIYNSTVSGTVANESGITVTAGSITVSISNQLQVVMCDMAANTGDKVVYYPGFELTPGAVFAVKFIKGNTNNSPKLIVNGNAAKSIYKNGSSIGGSVIGAGDIVVFYYYNNAYHIVLQGKECLMSALNNSVYVGGQHLLTVSEANSFYLPLTGGKTLTGDLTIGTASANKKLTVSGETTINNDLTVGNSTDNDNTLAVYGYIKSYKDADFEVDCTVGNNLTVDGLIYGTVSGGSDIRYKDVVKENYMPTVKQIADAPAIQFTWKDKEDKALHAGTSAQYWQEVMPEIVHEDKDGKLSIEYATAGLLSAIAVARVVEQYESRIKALEDKLAAMEGSDSSGETT